MPKSSSKKSTAPQEAVKVSEKSLVTGTVVSNKMNKTLVVQTMRLVKHPVYGKYQRKYSKMYVHDLDNSAREGDVVKIKQSRPLSKLKSWTLVEIVRRAEVDAGSGN